MRFITATVLLLASATVIGTASGQTIFPGETGSQLIESLRGSYTPSAVLDINDSRDTLFGVLHLEAGDSVRGVYTGMTIFLDTAADPNTDALAKGMNVEHTLPQSAGATDGTQAHADLHNLYPTRAEVNTDRSNFPLAEIDDDDTDFWFCDEQELTSIPDVSIIDTCSELDNETQTFEPREDQKGNAARSIFYMFTIYRDQMDRRYFAEQRSVLQAWHQQDPADTQEEDRSDLIATYQDGKINPFVDDATLVDRAFFMANGGSAALSELRTDQNSTDNDEYFELAGGSGDDLTGLTYIVIGDGTGGSGVIEHLTDLSGLTVPTSGFFVGAESTFSLGSADLTTTLDFENSDNVTHLLVEGFSGLAGADLDIEDDGVLDSTPWTTLRECVALVETVGSGDEIYCATTIGPDDTFAPGHIYKDGSSWNIGTFDPVGTDDTPGSANTLPVELSSFDYIRDGTSIVLHWRTLSETGNAGFQIEHRRDDSPAWLETGFVEGAGTSTSARDYEFRVGDPVTGQHFFRLKQIDVDGTFDYSDVLEVQIDVVDQYELTAAYPNPFNATTSFSIAVPAAQTISIDLYNLLGQRVAPLFRGQVNSHEMRTIEIDGAQLTSGIYIYRIVGQTFSLSRQVTLIR